MEEERRLEKLRMEALEATLTGPSPGEMMARDMKAEEGTAFGAMKEALDVVMNLDATEAEMEEVVGALRGRLEALGSNAPYHEHSSRTEPDAALLERFENPSKSRPWEFSIDIETSEFTSLCPVTGQPDWATIKIRYAPEDWCVESKSLKLYLMSYRNHGSFHETIVDRICFDLIALLKPRWIEVKGEFTPRGGIPFWPRAYYVAPEEPPKDPVEAMEDAGDHYTEGRTIKVEAADGIKAADETGLGMSQLELDQELADQGNN